MIRIWGVGGMEESLDLFVFFGQLQRVGYYWLERMCADQRSARRSVAGCLRAAGL